MLYQDARPHVCFPCHTKRSLIAGLSCCHTKSRIGTFFSDVWHQLFRLKKRVFFSERILLLVWQWLVPLGIFLCDATHAISRCQTTYWSSTFIWIWLRASLTHSVKYSTCVFLYLSCSSTTLYPSAHVLLYIIHYTSPCCILQSSALYLNCYNLYSFESNGRCHAKRFLMVWVNAIPKEGWHRLEKKKNNKKIVKSWCHTKRRDGRSP